MLGWQSHCHPCSCRNSGAAVQLPPQQSVYGPRGVQARRLNMVPRDAVPQLLPLGGMIRDNRGMGRLCVALAIVMLLLGGCSPAAKPSHPTTASPPAPVPGPSPAVAEKPATKPGKAAAGQPPRLRDDFSLPLVIQLNSPPVPPGIQKPSPPIQEPKAP